LRENGFTEPILILGHTLEEDYSRVLEYGLTPIVYKYSQALELNRIAGEVNKKAFFHIKIDTGMGRLGFMPNRESVEEIKKISRLPNIELEGISTHLATADQVHNDFVKKQFDKFMYILLELEKEKIHIPIKHVSNSAATINFPEMHLDMVRPGTSLYGLYPGPEMAENPTIELYPVMSIKAKLVHIKSVPQGTPISYGGTFVTQKSSVIGVVPMGYVDGVFRQLANKGEVLIRGKRCPMIGNICMDQFMVDLTGLKEVEIGDEVVLVGAQGEHRITADEVGEKVGTISIEVVTRLGKRMPIVYND
ncbi:MAG: alanine racemase, partial [Halanaerobiales bacterium]|nr:alanine racemase [Halanaerobiales bacterium]